MTSDSHEDNVKKPADAPSDLQGSERTRINRIADEIAQRAQRTEQRSASRLVPMHALVRLNLHVSIVKSLHRSRDVAVVNSMMGVDGTRCSSQSRHSVSHRRQGRRRNCKP
jgi:hypothetical protein